MASASYTILSYVVGSLQIVPGMLALGSCAPLLRYTWITRLSSKSTKAGQEIIGILH